MPRVVREGLLEEGDVDLKGRAILKQGERGDTLAGGLHFLLFLAWTFSLRHDVKRELSLLWKNRTKGEMTTENSYLGPQRARSSMLSGLQKQGIA